MNGRNILRQYAQSKGKQAVSFVEVIPEFYSQDTLVTKDSDGNKEECMIDYKDLFRMIVNKQIKL